MDNKGGHSQPAALFSSVRVCVQGGGEAENIQPLSIGQLAIDRETK